MSSWKALLAFIIVIVLSFSLAGCAEKKESQTKSGILPNDIVTFGHYDYDSVSENKAEPLQWIVLTVKGNKALLLSRYGLWADSMDKDKTWASCRMRSYLNNQFILDAFFDDEKDCIQLTNVVTKKAPTTTYDKNDVITKDYVFLLSYDEVGEYLSNEQRLLRPTVSALKCGANTNSNYYGWWWLRTPPEYGKSYYFSFVNNQGELKYYVDFANVNDALIRPAMWIDIDQAKKLLTKTNGSDIFAPHQDNDSLLGSWVFTQQISSGYIFEMFGKMKLIIDESLQLRGNATTSTYSAKNGKLTFDPSILGLDPSIIGLKSTSTYDYIRYGDFIIMENDILIKQDLAHKITLRSYTSEQIPVVKRNEYEYTIKTPNTIDIVKYRGNASDVIIPDAIDGYQVQGIAAGAFKGNNRIRTITLPDSIDAIGSYAFTSCINLQEIIFPKNLSQIGKMLFLGCEKLESAIVNIRSIAMQYCIDREIPCYFQFGKYEQDNNLNNGKEPINWILLDRDSNSMRLISEYVLDCYPYYHSNDVDILNWFKTEFAKEAFLSDEEASIIQYSLLSEEDVSQLLTKKQRKGIPTKYALQNGAKYATFASVSGGKINWNAGTADYCYWWINEGAYYTDDKAYNLNYREREKSEQIGIRPVITLELLQSETKTMEINLSLEAEQPKPSSKKPLIIEQPKSIFVIFADKYEAYEGKTITFTCLADNVSGYAWEYSYDGKIWKNASILETVNSNSVATNKLSILVKPTDNLQFRCKITGIDGSIVFTDVVAPTF